MADTSISNEYFSRLKSRGYQAMYDHNDRKAADNPLLVFDRGGSVKTTRMSEITTSDVDNAIHYLEEKGFD